MRKLTEYSFPQEVCVHAKMYDLWIPNQEYGVAKRGLSSADNKAVKEWMKEILTKFFYRLINEAKLLVKKGDSFHLNNIEDWRNRLDLFPDTSEELVELKETLKDLFEKEDLNITLVVSDIANIYRFMEDFNPDTLVLESQRIQVKVGIGL